MPPDEFQCMPATLLIDEYTALPIAVGSRE
jgi:hypothetical protein